MPDKVDAYIEKQPSPQKEICQALRALINKTFPGVKEEIKWGVPVFADNKYYITALKDHVNLGFMFKGFTTEDEKLFDGGGKTMKHIKVASLAGIDEKRIVALLKLVEKRANG
jgi:hypothetical protein